MPAGCRDARPANDQRRVRAVVVELGLGEGQGHPVIGKEHHDGIVSRTGVPQGLKDVPHPVIGASHRRVVVGQFLGHHGIVEEKAGYGHLLGSKNARGCVPIGNGLAPAALRVEGLMRIGDIDHQAKWLARSPGRFNAPPCGNAVRFCVLDVCLRPVGQGVEDQVPRVGMVRRRV